MVDESISLQHVSVVITNSTLINTNITLYGNKKESVLVRNCSFKGSEIVVDSVHTFTIASSNFTAEGIALNEESRHMIRVHNVDFLQVNQTEFMNDVIDGNDDEIRNTQLGIQMENVSLADIANCTFTNLMSDSQNGSALLITSSEVHIRQSHFRSNIARNGVIYATTYANIMNDNSSFIANYAKESGSAIYMANNGNLKNSLCVMHNNRAEKLGGALYMEKFVDCLNYETSFTRNKAQAGGGAIFTKTNTNTTNVKCVFSGNGVGGQSNGGAVYAHDRVVSLNIDSTYYNNTAFTGGALSIKGPGQVGLYELPTAICKSTRKYNFSLIT